MGPAMTCIGVLGNIMSMALILSPLPTFLKILQKRSTEKFSPVSYAAIMLSTFLWLFYGSPLVKFGVLVETISGFGVGMESAFLVIFFVFASDRKTRIHVLMLTTSVLLLVALAVSFTVAFVHEKNRRRTVIGVVCAFVAVLMYASPLAIMRMVIRTKSTEYMPFLLSLMAFLNAALWCTYAVLDHDLYIMIPNAFGAGLGMAQLILYASYCRRPGDVDLELKNAGERIGSFTDLEPGQSTRNQDGEKTIACAGQKRGQATITIAAEKRSSVTDSDVLLSPGREMYVQKLHFGVDRS